MRASSRRSGLLLAVGILAVGGLASAATGHGEFRTLNESVPTTEAAPAPTDPPDSSPETSQFETTTTMTDESADSNVLADPSAAVVDPPPDTPPYPCADGNHGKTVSEVARATPAGPGHGQAVSEAAKSDCGKAMREADDESTVTEADDDLEATEAEDDDVADDPAADREQGQQHKHQSHGKSDGKGKGKGKRP